MYLFVMILPVVVSGVLFFWRLNIDRESERAFRAKLSGVILK
jgi:hypothetical protein